MVEQPQVLIVGSGPTGLIAALSLVKNGVPVRIIEKEASFHASSRGSGVTPRVQELEYFLGILPDIIKQSIPVLYITRYDSANPRRVLTSKRLTVPMDRTPAIPIAQSVCVNQYLHEQVLREHLQALGSRVELGVELVDLQQDENGVTTKLAHHDGNGETLSTETASFPYVIGADGGKSIVRGLIGLEFLGETHETEKLLNCDVDLEKGFEGNAFHIFGDEHSLGVSFRSTNIPGRYQMVIIGPKYYEISDECNRANLEELQKIVVGLTGNTDIVIKKLHHKSEWRLNVRMANQFQVGRVFVIGDAAHTHSPAGGQGLTTGSQDAFNLAWKLALVLRGASSPALLETYGEERLPVVADMLLETTRLHKMIYESRNDESGTRKAHSAMDELGKAAAPLAATNASVQNEKGEEEPFIRGRKLLQLGVNYRWSSIVLDDRKFEDTNIARNAYGGDEDGVRAGDRAPDAPELGIILKGPDVDKFNKKLQGRKDVTRLFDVFMPTAHTILIFSADANLRVVTQTQDLLARLPKGLTQSVVIVPSRAELVDVASVHADLVLSDDKGHAKIGYGVEEGTTTFVVVRPDGVVGAYVRDLEGLEKYFSKIFDMN